jgi:hypothetical protein
MNTIDLYHFLLISNVKCEIGRLVRLWSMSQVPEEPIYELWLEQNYTINPSFDERADYVLLTSNFIGHLR